MNHSIACSHCQHVAEEPAAGEHCARCGEPLEAPGWEVVQPGPAPATAESTAVEAPPPAVTESETPRKKKRKAVNPPPVVLSSILGFLVFGFFTVAFFTLVAYQQTIPVIQLIFEASKHKKPAVLTTTTSSTTSVTMTVPVLTPPTQPSTAPRPATGKTTERAPSGKTYKTIYARVDAARKLRRVTTSLTGSSLADSTAYSETPKEPSILIGLEVTLGTIGSTKGVQSLTPLFRSEEGTFSGKPLGTPDGTAQRIQARPGYAVGAIRIMFNQQIHAVSLRFMAIKGDRLDPGDQYDSEWFGTPSEGKESTLGGTGQPIFSLGGRKPKDSKACLMGLGVQAVAKDF